MLQLKNWITKTTYTPEKMNLITAQCNRDADVRMGVGQCANGDIFFAIINRTKESVSNPYAVTYLSKGDTHELAELLLILTAPPLVL